MMSEHQHGQHGDSNTNIDVKWTRIADYFLQLSDISDISTKNMIFKCLLCGPKEKRISTSVSSNSNLRTHIKVCIIIIILS